MAIAISAASTSAAGSLAVQSKKQASPERPTWDQKKVYKYLEDLNQAILNYGKQMASYYRSVISQQEGDGTMSVEDLKKEIKEWFPEYTLTDSEPSSVVKGKNYLYIDQSQLRKMASDPEYRAKVYGLMDRELQSGKGFTMQYSDGKNVTHHLTGSIFSLCEANRKYAGPDGIPYCGSCTGTPSYSTSSSHLQVRSMSFLYDHIDPARSAAKERKAAAASVAEKEAKKWTRQKQEAKKMEEKRAVEKAASKKAAARKAEQKELAQELNAVMIERQVQAQEMVDELLEQQRRAGEGTFLDTKA